jgi:hypothetical protein
MTTPKLNGKRSPKAPAAPGVAGFAAPDPNLANQSVFTAAQVQLQRRMRFNPLRMLTPENLSLYLDQFDIGILNLAARLWDAMVRRDDTLSFLKPQSEATIAAQPWGVFMRTGADPKEAARHKACLDYFYDHVRATDAFDRNIRGGRHLLIQQMMSADSYQYAVHHFIWDPRPGVTVDVDGAAPAPVISAVLEHVPLMYFENTTGTLRFLPMGGFGIEGQELDWENEWMCSTGRGVMFAASISYVFKRLAFQDWTVFNERYAQNKVLGQTNAAQGSPQGQAMAEIIANFNGDQGIVLFESQPGDKPPISLIGPEGTTSVDLFERFLQRQDAKMSVLYRGSDRANEAGEKQENGITAQMDETSRLEHSHCQRLADACQQGIDRKVIALCFGEGVEPLAYFGLPDIEEDDAKEVRESAGFLADRGAKVDLPEVADRLGVSLTENDDDALQPVAAAGGADETDETAGDGLNKTANASRWNRLRELVEQTLKEKGVEV